MDKTVKELEQELQSRIDELSRAKDDIENLLDSTEIATIFLDVDLRVRRFSSAATSIAPLTDADLGRSIKHLTSNLVETELDEVALEVLRDLAVQKKEVKSKNGQYYNMRVHPCRTVNNLVDGVIITFEDITERKQAEELIRYRLRLEKMANEVSVSFVNAEAAGIDDAINSALEKIARFAGANRSSLFLFSDDLELLTNTHEWCDNPQDSQIALLQNIPFSTFGWHREELLQHKTISISKLEDYPKEAKGEREWIKEHGFRALLFIPLLKQGHLQGGVGFYGETGKEVTWPSEFVNMLETAGNIILNILERRQAEEALRESEAKWRSLTENSPDTIMTVDINGTIQFMNRVLDDVSGRSDVIGTSVYEYVPPEHKDIVRTAIGRVFGTGTSERYQISVKNLEGSIVGWFETRVGPVFDGETIVAATLASHEITERRQAEIAIRRSERWLSTTLSSIGDAVITTDVDSKIFFMNPVATVLTGWELEEAKDRPLVDVFDIISEETLQPVENLVSKVLKGKSEEGAANHTILISKDGTRRPIADSGAPITDNGGEILGIVLVFRDITAAREQEAIQRQNQKLQSIGTLAAGVAHEINNPLNGIMNYGELIRIRLDSESPLIDFAKGIVEESQRIAIIVRNLLSFSRQDRETHSPVNMADIVTDMLSLTMTAFRKDQINVLLDIPDDLPKIKCRDQQIMQVLANLLNNARDALNERYPDYDDDKVVTISITPFEKESKPWIRTTIEDQGTGISKDISDIVFDPFYTTKPRDEGTGLGLSISHGIVKEHGGDLWFESIEAEYTRFHLDLQVK
ncbi:MAG: PAS domain S-box protein [Proteobacteria bacterium]|nr:PAS domain S-box protein [Pseudomonadota bacterium]